MKPSTTEIQDFFKKLGYSLQEESAQKLSLYLSFLTRFNAHMNLVGTQSWQDTCKNLIVDSFELASFIKKLPIPPEPVTWDIGAGGGIPGIPLRTVWTKGSYTMIELREKRALFLQTVLAQISLPQTFVFHGRIEKYMKNNKADLILSRAFMPWEKACVFLRLALKKDSVMIFLLKKIPEMTHFPDLSVTHSHKYFVNGDERVLVAIKNHTIS